MEQKILIVATLQTNLVDSLIYLMEQEKLEYELVNGLNSNNDASTIIYVTNDEKVLTDATKLSVPTIIISSKKVVVQQASAPLNYIITNLVNDEINYSDVQKEYLFKKGVYAILNAKVLEFINDENPIDGLITDITECKVIPSEWIFKFDSIAETYSWLSKKNKVDNNNFTEKGINFYNNSKVYNDSSKEINYLVDKVMNIKNGRKIIDIFICTKEEFRDLKTNYFFKTLLNNISNTYQIYYVDKDIFALKEPDLLKNISDGLIIYADCVYKDTYNDEFSLGYVDCNESSINKYNEYFDYIFNNYAQKINSDGDINGI